MSFEFNSIEEIAADLAAGKPVVMLDNEDRENEGDVICAAEFATTENVNFMAKWARGLICMPMDASYADKLNLPQMCITNTDNHCTAFSVSVDHVDTTTGISAEERGYTARKFVDDNAKPDDFRRPGHMFPLQAVAGGVIERNGHTEATVDLMKVAGLKPCGLCCEIMKDDGTMARKDDLVEFAKVHGLKISTIEKLVQYRKEHEVFVECVAKAKLPTKYGEFTICGYINKLNGEHHVALTMGDIADGKPVLCRVHSECLTGDCFGSQKCDCGQQLDAAMKAIAPLRYRATSIFVGPLHPVGNRQLCQPKSLSWISGLLKLTVASSAISTTPSIYREDSVGFGSCTPSLRATDERTCSLFNSTPSISDDAMMS